MRKVRENVVEKALVSFAKYHGIYCRKSTGSRGIPDREFLFKGVWLKLEIKRPGERLTDYQKDEINLINGHGGHATWVDNIDDGKRLLLALCQVGLVNIPVGVFRQTIAEQNLKP